MRLISLEANKKTFRPIIFNPEGLSLIVGRQKTPAKADATRTYNGVGKSLAIFLINFCLGSGGSGTNKNLKESIPDWEFILKFELNSQNFVSSRNTSNQNIILLNEEPLSVVRFRAELEDLIFDIPESVKGLKFRALMDKFIRPRKGSYVSYGNANDQDFKPYNNLVRNCFLLGIDTELVKTKQSLKEEKDKIKTFKDNLAKDPIFKEYFTANKNVEIEIKDLEEKIEQISKNVDVLEIAINYHQIQQEADNTKRLLQEAKNKEFVLIDAIKNINDSLDIKPDISDERLLKIYAEANVSLPKNVVKTVQQVKDFHEQLLRSRVQRLSVEKSKLERELKEIEETVTNLNKERDSQLGILANQGKLKDYVTTTNYLNNLKNKAQKIKDYVEYQEKYQDKIQQINIDLTEETKKTTDYLRRVKPLIDENLQTFRNLSKRFYPDRPAGLLITNNDGENQIRFDIEAKIQDDASDGINEVKIFCFDMTLLLSQHNHNMRFIVHDSRLFSDMDYRKRAILFRIADEITREKGYQYIATLNEDHISSMKEEFSEEEFESLIQKNTILNLTDEGANGKLLGLQVDMDYES